MNQHKRDRILYAKPSITKLELDYAADAAANGWGPRCYDYVLRFEEQFAKHLKTRHAIATSSGTGALHLGMAALGIGAGDEVILGDINWIASVAPIVHLGATPILVDVCEESWCLDPSAVEAAVSPKTKAILAVHLYGNVCDIDALSGIARRHGIHLIEDAAEAIGSSWRGRPAGAMGAFGAFSFHGTKTITTGEGGAIVCDDDELYERILTLSNHGRARGETRQFWPERIGYKFKMSNIQAAIGCAQLERVDELIAGKRRVFMKYFNCLQNLPLNMNPEPLGTQNGYWMPTIVAHDSTRQSRDALLAALVKDDVDSRLFFWPLSTLPMFADKPEHTVSHSLSQRALNLPSYHDLKDSDIERVAEHVHRHFGESPK